MQISKATRRVNVTDESSVFRALWMDDVSVGSMLLVYPVKRRWKWLDVTPHYNLERAHALLSWDEDFDWPHLDHAEVGQGPADLGGGASGYTVPDIPF